MLFCHPEKKGKKAPPITILGEDSPPFFLSHPKAKLEAIENVGSSLPMLSAKNKAKTAACPFFILGKEGKILLLTRLFPFRSGEGRKIGHHYWFYGLFGEHFP